MYGGVMKQTEQTTRDRLLLAARQLLEEKSDPSGITAREITSRAGTGLGAINYHFDSKDDLLNQAVIDLINTTAAPWLTSEAVPDDRNLPPVIRLRQLLQETARVAARFPALSRLPIGYTLRVGDYSVPTMIVPLLREIFPPGMPESSLKLKALQLITPMQFGFYHAAGFQRYSGMNLEDEAVRDRVIDELISNLIQDDIQ
jgi:AcrR family transcriptional regulator